MKQLIFFLVFMVGFIALSFGSLIITEVSFDGSDEWIEITNLGPLFSGQIEIDGAKGDVFTIILTGFTSDTSRLIGDQLSAINNFSGINYMSGKGLSLKDTQGRDITLSTQGSQLNSFSASTELVQQYNNTTSTLQLFQNQSGTNFITGSVANPGLYNVQITEAPSPVPTNSPTSNPTQSPTSTPSSIPKNALQYGDLLISEIHQSDTEYYGEYLELYAMQDYIGDVTIEGLGQGSGSKTFSIHVSQGEYIVLTDTPELIESHVYISSISLADSGETLILYGQDRQMIDTVVYTNGEKGSSLYLTDDIGSFRAFDTHNIPTPGYSTTNIKHLLSQKTDSQLNCNIHLQNNNTLYHNNSINLVATIESDQIQNSNQKYTCSRSGAATGFDVDKCNPSGYIFNTIGILPLSVVISHNDGRTCTTTLDLNLPEEVEAITCKQEYYQNLYSKRKDKYTNECGSASTGGGSEDSGSLDYTGRINETIIIATPETPFVDRQLTIEAVLPNPIGTDGDLEGIRIKNLGNSDVDITGLVVNAGKRQRSIDGGSLGAGDISEIFGDLGLYNRDACIRLEHEGGYILDEFCYPSPKDDVWYTLHNTKQLQYDISFDGSNKNKYKEVCLENDLLEEDELLYLGTPGATSLLASAEVGTYTGSLKIEAVLPNPEGVDGDLEGINIRNTGIVDIDITGLVVNAGKRQRSIGTGTIEPGEMLQYFGDLGLYNRDACIRLELKSGYVFDEFCYPKPNEDTWYSFDITESIFSVDFDGEYSSTQQIYEIDKITPKSKIHNTHSNNSESYEGEIRDGSVVGIKHMEYVNNVIHISSLLPNPKGADGDLEGIKILNMSTQNINLDNLIINAGKRQKALGSGNLTPGQELVIYGNLGLYNKAACMRLEDSSGNIYDEFCYSSPKDDVWYSESNDFTSLASTDWMGSLSLLQNNEEVCIMSGHNELLCKNNGYASKYDKEKEKYDIKNLENKLHKEYIYSTSKLLRSDRGPVWYDTQLAYNYNHRKELSDAISSENQSIDFATIRFSPQEVVTSYKLHSDTFPLSEIALDKVFPNLLLHTNDSRNNFKKNLKHITPLAKK